MHISSINRNDVDTSLTEENVLI